MKALVTGGAGFIGSHLVDALLTEGWDVRILDNLDPQVHGLGQRTPDYLSRDAELQIGDIRDPTAVAAALDGVDAVFHEAAAVGVGQSMYEIARYVETNSLGAAVLLQAIVERRDPVRKLIVASSMSVYGGSIPGCKRAECLSEDALAGAAGSPPVGIARTGR
jgi:dTDP-L-rhamnose 4-epimerase